ncbi:Nif3-like dinuclear metal center hexameric protein [Paenibacillus oryzisoli]|uniref:Nif3-like dinuclear metal center hexameric protein n=1 Tax=Paenibacillus oryzisoli TaxID=1850517 RepID=UPI003D2964D3
MITVQTIIDKLTEPVGVLKETTDRLIAGGSAREVRRVAVTFNSSYASIRSAVDGGADLLITHEPTFYSHLDETDWLQGEAIYEQKRKLIEESGLAIYRFHDYWHRYQPDGILSGLLAAMRWETCARAQTPFVVDVLKTTVRQLADDVKRRLGLPSIQLIGNPEQAVSVVCLSPGMEGGRRQIAKLMRDGVDLLIAGETLSWETEAYVQDALDVGALKAMLVLGHMSSEEPGMRAVVDLLRALFPELEAFFVPGTSGAVWL